MDRQITKIQFRQDTSVNWATNNPILSKGEPGYDISTKSFKIGDGDRAWNSLPFLSSESIISEPYADGKLYGRVVADGSDSGNWREIVIPVVDHRKNFNDILEAQYDNEIDMGFTINVNGHTKKVFGVKKRITNINLDITSPKCKKLALTHVYSIVDVKGTFDCSHDYVYQINAYNPECYSYTSLDTNNYNLYLVSILNDTTRQVNNSSAELYVMYTKVNDSVDDNH